MGLQCCQEGFGNSYLGEACCSLETIPSLYRGNTRNNGNGYSSITNGVHPVYKQVDIVKHLRENKINSGVNFFLEILHLLITLHSREGLVLWETGDRNI